MKSENTSKIISRSAIALALCISFLLIFRGPISIIAAFFIPTIINIFSVKDNKLYFILTFSSLFMITFLFFQTQTIFVFGYLVIALAMKIVLLDKNKKIKVTSFSFAIYVLSVVFILFLGIWFTEFILNVPLHSMMVTMSDGNVLKYFFILLIEAIVISIFNILIFKSIQ